MALLLAGCDRPYHQKKDGDVDVALIQKRNGCNGGQAKEKACKLMKAFDEASDPDGRSEPPQLSARRRFTSSRVKTLASS